MRQSGILFSRFGRPFSKNRQADRLAEAAAPTVDAFSGTLSVSDTAYVNGAVYLCKMSITNTTTTPTLNLNGIGAKTIYKNGGAAIAASDLIQNAWYMFLYQTSGDLFMALNI